MAHLLQNCHSGSSRSLDLKQLCTACLQFALQPGDSGGLCILHMGTVHGL